MIGSNHFHARCPDISANRGWSAATLWFEHHFLWKGCHSGISVLYSVGCVEYHCLSKAQIQTLPSLPHSFRITARTNMANTWHSFMRSAAYSVTRLAFPECIYVPATVQSETGLASGLQYLIILFPILLCPFSLHYFWVVPRPTAGHPSYQGAKGLCSFLREPGVLLSWTLQTGDGEGAHTEIFYHCRWVGSVPEEIRAGVKAWEKTPILFSDEKC